MIELHGLDTENEVFFYEQDFYVLSNFSAFALYRKCMRFDTSEAAQPVLRNCSEALQIWKPAPTGTWRSATRRLRPDPRHVRVPRRRRLRPVAQRQPVGQLLEGRQRGMRLRVSVSQQPEVLMMRTCDGCGETWEDDFFEEHEELVEVSVPDPMWELAPIGSDMIDEERSVLRSFCLNCCH